MPDRPFGIMCLLCMHGELQKISSGFEKLKRLRARVVETAGAVEQRVTTLRKAHEDLVTASPQSACALGLDSLHFQVRLVTMELQSLRDMIHAVENHIYYECLYLHRSIQSYAASEISDKVARDRVLAEREYPPYKHLDRGARYDFEVTVGLHAQLVASIQAMGEHCDEQADVIENEKGKFAQGLNIDSLVHSNAYVHALLQAKTSLFLRSLGAFNVHHGKYLRRIQDKGQLVLDAITRDVRLAGAPAVAAAPAAVPRAGSPRSSSPSNSDTASDGASRLTEAQRARKRAKQKKMRARQQEKRAHAADAVEAPDSPLPQPTGGAATGEELTAVQAPASDPS